MKTHRHSNPLGALLSENDALRPLLQKARRARTLQQIYLDALPTVFGKDLPELDIFVQTSRVTAFAGSTLFIGAASASVATRVKQVLPRLLSIIQKQEQEVTEIRVEVQPGWQEARKAIQAEPRLPIPSATLADLSANLADSPLKDAVDQIRRRQARQQARPRSNDK